MSFGILRRFVNTAASNSKPTGLRRLLNTAASDSEPIRSGQSGAGWRHTLSGVMNDVQLYMLVATPIAWFLNMPKLRYEELLEEITELHRRGTIEDMPSQVKEDLLKGEEALKQIRIANWELEHQIRKLEIYQKRVKMSSKS